MTLQEAGMKGGDKGRDRDRSHCSGQIPFCRAMEGTTQSRSGNKDMISSGANFLGALKNVAGKIWSTVITEEDKDKKVSGRAPGLGTPETPEERQQSFPSSLSNYPWCLSHEYHWEKACGEDKHSLLLIRVQCWGKVTACRRTGILFPWQLKFEKSIWKSMSSSHVCSTQSQESKLCSCNVLSSCPPGEQGSELLFHLVWNNSVTTWRKPHTRQRKAGIWRGGRNLQNKFQTIQSRAINSSMSIKAQLLSRGEQHGQDQSQLGWGISAMTLIITKVHTAMGTPTVKD